MCRAAGIPILRMFHNYCNTIHIDLMFNGSQSCYMKVAGIPSQMAREPFKNLKEGSSTTHLSAHCILLSFLPTLLGATDWFEWQSGKAPAEGEASTSWGYAGAPGITFGTKRAPKCSRVRVEDVEALHMLGKCSLSKALLVIAVYTAYCP